MTTLRTAAQQALEALWYYHATEFRKDTHAGKAIAVLQAALTEEALQRFTDVQQEMEAALAEPVYEPVQVCWLSKLQPDAYLPNGELNPKYLKPALAEPVQERQCNPHPKAPHGFMRNASHTEDRYVCECEYWEPYEAGYQAGMEAALRAQS